MDVLDSNLWVFAGTGTNRTAIELVEGAVSGEREIAINAYIHQEVVRAFERSSELSGAETDEAIEDFLAVLNGYPTIHTDFTQADVRALDLDTYRLRPNNRLLAAVLDIQPKDVPLVTLAFRYYDRGPTIYTNDRAFATLDPSEYNLPEMGIEFVPSDDANSSSER